ncbi:MAG TPA: chorismate synthase [Pyrinomonadaceae bacterium]|nr:chorismate synthase [Pyrinomonadaceae bacterium]HMP66056.1 chorismate synthase [Pyrinomonadaceae bacterium]
MNDKTMHFRFTTAGESHGPALVTIVEGVPAGLPIDKSAIDRELWRRQQGYGRGGRMKIESDTVRILSGVRHGRSLGSPIALLIENKDFVHWKDVMSAEPLTKEPQNPRTVTRPRPGHADLAGGQKYQARDLRDILERASARETASRVAAGAVAKQLLAIFGIELRSHVVKLGAVPASPLAATWEAICEIPEDSLINCADPLAEAQIIMHIDETKKNGDTLGGIFEVVARGVPVGLGSHTSWEDKLDGRIARAVMSIHAVKAVEIGSGVANAGLPGSEVHDEIFWKDKDRGSDTSSGFARRTNRAGGLEGGITNGEELRVRGYMKPISTLRKPLESVDVDTKESSLAAFERSDITAVPAAGVIGESMIAIVLANSMREKFGGDSLDEMTRNYSAYMDSVEAF